MEVEAPSMQIDLPQDIAERLQTLARLEKLESEVEAIRKALDVLDSQERERRAIQAGVDAWHCGDVQDFDEFDSEFRARNGIS
jgi:predicted transcriptional regulator